MQFKKIIAFGKGSHIISLPKRWVERNKLMKGDLLVMEDLGHALSLSVRRYSPEEKTTEKRINIDKRSIEAINSEIVTEYLNNTHTMIFVGKEINDKSKDIKKIIMNLAGLEILEQTSTRMVAIDLINPIDISIPNLIRRIDTIIRGMMSDSMQILDGKNTYDSIMERDSDINRLYFLGCRIIRLASKTPSLQKEFGLDVWELYNLKSLLRYLEELADKQKRIARYLSRINFDRGSSSIIKDIYKGLSKHYIECMTAYYKNDKAAALSFEIGNKTRSSQAFSLIKHIPERPKQENPQYITRIIENMEGTKDCIKNIWRAELERD